MVVTATPGGVGARVGVSETVARLAVTVAEPHRDHACAGGICGTV